MDIDKSEILKITKEELNGKTLSEYLGLYFGEPRLNDGLESEDDTEGMYIIEQE